MIINNDRVYYRAHSVYGLAAVVAVGRLSQTPQDNDRESVFVESEFFVIIISRRDPRGETIAIASGGPSHVRSIIVPIQLIIIRVHSTDRVLSRAVPYASRLIRTRRHDDVFKRISQRFWPPPPGPWIVSSREIRRTPSRRWRYVFIIISLDDDNHIDIIIRLRGRPADTPSRVGLRTRRSRARTEYIVVITVSSPPIFFSFEIILITVWSYLFVMKTASSNPSKSTGVFRHRI